MKAPRGLQEIKSPTTTTTSFTWKSGTLDMDSSDSFTLGFPLFLFFPPTQKPARNSSRNAFSTYMNSILIPRTKPLFFPLPLSLSFFFEREERGVFFFLHHYPGNLIHTEYNGEERGRLDRGLEEIMKFVHIQASWKVPPLSQLPPSFLFRLPSPAFPPPHPPIPPEKGAQGLLLCERQSGKWEGAAGVHLEMVCFQFVSVSGKWREQMISIFSLASGPTTTFLITKGTWRGDSTPEWPSIKPHGAQTHVHIQWGKSAGGGTLLRH